ncbi:MAG: hypothetical protein RLP02_02555 [Coleofasciculus sp. C2-GNP5-27]
MVIAKNEESLYPQVSNPEQQERLGLARVIGVDSSQRLALPNREFFYQKK